MCAKEITQPKGAFSVCSVQRGNQYNGLYNCTIGYIKVLADLCNSIQ